MATTDEWYHRPHDILLVSFWFYIYEMFLKDIKQVNFPPLNEIVKST